MTGAVAREVAPAALTSPFKGLAPYDDSSLDEQLFFGREREVDVACANLTASRLTVLFGASGVGKSSLLRAGVMRRLRESGAGESAAAIVSSWAGDPVSAIAAAARAAVEEALGRSVDDPGGRLVERLRAWTDELGGELALVLDQLEEEFLYHADEDGPGSFAIEFPPLVTERGLPVHVLIGIREDSLGRLDAFRAAIPGVLSNYLRLERLDRDAARLAITGPIERWNQLVPDDAMTAEPELVEAVLDEVAAGRIEPDAAGIGGVTPSALVERIEAPYLQLVLERLWSAERAEGSPVLRRETLRRLGGAGHVVEEHLERSLSSLDAGERDAASSLFAYLVTPSGTKIAHRLDDLASYTGLGVAATAALVAELTRERILRVADGGRVEIFHDVLAEAIAGWRRRYEASRELERHRREADARHRRLVAILAGVLVVLLVVGGIAVYALTQRSEAQEQAALAQANEQRAEEQAALAQANEQKAQEQAALAQQERAAAQRSAAAARESAAEARRQRGIAEQQAGVAQANEQAAQASAAQAEASRSEAQAQAAFAEQQRTKAQAAEGRARVNAATARTQARRASAAARVARARELGALADTTLATDPEVSVRLALRAVKLAPSQASLEDVLRRSLIELRVRKILPGGSPVGEASFSPDGRRVVTAGDGGEARIFDASSGRLLRRLRHAPGVNATAFSPDGRTVATAGRNGSVVLWSADTGATLHTLRHAAAVRDVAFSPDGRLVLSASDDATAAVWDAGSAVELLRLRHPRGLLLASFSRDGRYFSTVTGDSVVRVFESATGAAAATLEQRGEVTGAVWSPAGDVLVSTGRRNAYVWSTSTWSQLRLLEGHTAPIRAAAFSPDGRLLVTAGVDSSARVWRVDTGALVHDSGAHGHEVSTVAFSPDGQTVVTGSHDRTAAIWSVTGAVRGRSLVGHRDTVTAVSFSPDGGTVLTASLDGTARLWDPTGEPVMPVVGRHEGEATAAAFNPDATLVVSGGTDRAARIWRRGGKLVATLRHDGRVTVARFVARGSRVLTASEDGTARLWRSDGRALVVFRHGAPVRAAAALPDGSLVATGGDDGTVRLWRSGGAPAAALRHAAAVSSVSFSPDGTRLLSTSADGTAKLWAVSGALLRTFAHADAVTTAAFSPDGAHVVTAGADRLARVWNVVTGRRESEYAGHEDTITSAVFGPDGRLVLTADRSGDARTWNATTGKLVRMLRGHVALVSEARFSGDGRWIVTAGPSAGGLWEARTGNLLFFLRGHGRPLNAASFSADGRWILTAGRDGSVRRYRCVICGRVPDLVRLANGRLRSIER